MGGALTESIPLELFYTIPKPFFTDSEQSHLELPPYLEIDPRNGASSRSIPVHVEAFLPSWRGQRSQLQPFDEIEFILYGAVKSQIQNKVAVQKILYSIELRRWSDFNRHQRGKSSERLPPGGRYYCDLIFPINQSLDSRSSTKSHRLLPSIDIRASKYVTKSTALNDQHLITGRCEVIYCVEARVISSDDRRRQASTTTNNGVATQLVISSIINLQPNPSMIRLIPPRKLLKGEHGSFEVEVEVKGSNALRMKNQCQSLLSGTSRHLHMRPKILFSIQQSLAQSHAVTTSSASTSTFNIPVTMTVSFPTVAASTFEGPNEILLRRHLIQAGFPYKIEVTSTWHTKYNFTTNPDYRSSQENTIENHTIRRDAKTLKFPPFYEISKSQYTATTDLEISVVAGMSTTSNDGLLKVQHFLSLALEIGQEEASTMQIFSGSRMTSLTGMTTKNMRVECLVDV